jgi:hypothetical protein
MIYSKKDLRDLFALKKIWSKRLLGDSRPTGFRVFTMAPTADPQINVVGVGIGEKIEEHQPTGVLALKFFVQRKYPRREVARRELLPETIDGLPVDVEQSGVFREFRPRPRKSMPRWQSALTKRLPDPKERYRPAQPGCSVGFALGSPDAGIMAGTFGALVRNAAGTYILSNNHVLANEGRQPMGAPIFQPGLLDDGDPNRDQVAALSKFVRLRPRVLNKVDAAMAKASQRALLSPEILHIGAPKGTTRALIDMRVHKFGRTTGYSAGRVTSVATDVTVAYDTGHFIFGDQIIIVADRGSFSSAGDSGSLILERRTNKAVGLLFAGSFSHTIANHIGDVLKALGVSLA